MKCKWGIEDVNGEMPASQPDIVISSFVCRQKRKKTKQTWTRGRRDASWKTIFIYMQTHKMHSHAFVQSHTDNSNPCHANHFSSRGPYGPYSSWLIALQGLICMNNDSCFPSCLFCGVTWRFLTEPPSASPTAASTSASGYFTSIILCLALKIKIQIGLVQTFIS